LIFRFADFFRFYGKLLFSCVTSARTVISEKSSPDGQFNSKISLTFGAKVHGKSDFAADWGRLRLNGAEWGRFLGTGPAVIGSNRRLGVGLSGSNRVLR
jgi:hypothetical protein